MRDSSAESRWQGFVRCQVMLNAAEFLLPLPKRRREGRCEQGVEVDHKFQGVRVESEGLKIVPATCARTSASL